MEKLTVTMKENVIRRLKEKEEKNEIDILSETDSVIIWFDKYKDCILTWYFENRTISEIKNTISDKNCVSYWEGQKLIINKEVLSEILVSIMPNYLNMLNGIRFVYNKDTLSELYSETNDEEALFLFDFDDDCQGEGMVACGRTWLDKGFILINVNSIINAALEECSTKEKIVKFINSQILLIIFHELRHLYLMTNPCLDNNIAENLNQENNVEFYAESCYKSDKMQKFKPLKVFSVQ